MSTLKIEEEFELDSPPDTVFRFLIDPEKVVVCLPGAGLEGQENETTYKGNMRVKVGPVTVKYKGTVEFQEIDHEARLVKMSGKGREKGGGGTARMTMESVVYELDNGGSRVTVVSDVQLAGRIVRFGRGMVQSVSKQIFKQFTALVAENVALEAEPEDVEAAGERTADEVRAGDVAAAAEAGEEAAGAPATAMKPVHREAEPLRIVPILFKAFWGWITKPFRRLFGRKKD